MPRIPDSFLAELQYRADITDLVSAYVPLRQSGRTLRGLCPFHGEKTPSFFVYPDTQSFYCFGCGAAGGAVQFVQRAENLGFVEAVAFLAQRTGLAMPDTEDDGSARLRMRLLEANREAARAYFDTLCADGGRAALDYLRGRGLSPGMIRRFGLGFAPESGFMLTDSLRARGFSEEELLSAGLSRRSARGTLSDVFRGRVMFPIIDLRGNVIAFGGRRLGEGGGPKYLNTNDTPVFKKSRNLYALGLAKAQKAGYLILAEGYMDVIALHQAGFSSAVAALGTALTPEQARLMVQYAPEAVLAYDSDAAGQTATRRAADLLDRAGARVRVLTVQGAKDPDEYIRRFGKAAFDRLLTGSGSALDYEIAQLRAAHDLTSPDGKVAYSRGFCRLLADVRNPVEADVYCAAAAEELGIAKDAILASVETVRKQRRKQDARKSDADLHLFSEETPARREDPQRTAHRRAAVAEDRLIRLLLKNPDYGGRILAKLPNGDVLTDLNSRILRVLFAKIAAGAPLALTAVAPELDDAALRHLGWLLATGESLSEEPGAADDYADVINDERRKLSRGAVPETDTALYDYIEQIAKAKK